MYNENNKVAMAIKASASFRGDFAAINLIAVSAAGAHLTRFKALSLKSPGDKPIF